MIAQLSGKLLEKSLDYTVIDVHGVGYEVSVTFFTYNLLPEAGENVTLFTYTYVREDTLSLFGFFTKEEREFFVILMGVTKVGAKKARNILSGIQPVELCKAVETEDLEVLKKIPGVGAKLAQRLILELKDKLSSLSHNELDTGCKTINNTLLSDIHSALANLGYATKRIDNVLEKIKKSEDMDSLSLEKALKIALKAL